MLMRFGKPVQIMTEPGIYLKLPYPFHRVVETDARIMMLSPRPSEFLTADKKNILLESAICYRIVDPLLFIETVRDQNGLEVRLTDLLASHTGLLLGKAELSNIVNVDVKQLKLEAMNTELTTLLQKEGQTFGVDIKQVFIKGIMMPYENRQAVYKRMGAERKRIAAKYIAEGEEESSKITAEADKVSRTILAEAQSKATIIRGQADAKAMETYRITYEKNMDFYRYIRSLEAYETMFNEKSVIILDEKSPIVKTLFSGGTVDKR